MFHDDVLTMVARPFQYSLGRRHRPKLCLWTKAPLAFRVDGRLAEIDICAGIPSPSMIYSSIHSQCNGYCSGRQSFGLNLNLASVQLEPLKSPFHRLGCRMDVTSRDDDAAVSSDSHNRKRIHCRLSQPCKHCMTQRVQDKIFWKDRAALAVDLRRDCVAVDDLSTYRDKEILLGWQRRKEWILTCGGFLEYLTPLNVDRDVRIAWYCANCSFNLYKCRAAGASMWSRISSILGGHHKPPKTKDNPRERARIRNRSSESFAG
jgi:hypothetical protein